MQLGGLIGKVLAQVMHDLMGRRMEPHIGLSSESISDFLSLCLRSSPMLFVSLK